MASSSIEVMGGGAGDVKVMLMDDGVADGTMAEEMHTIITSDTAQAQIVTAVEAVGATSQEEVKMKSCLHVVLVWLFYCIGVIKLHCGKAVSMLMLSISNKRPLYFLFFFWYGPQNTIIDSKRDTR